MEQKVLTYEEYTSYASYEELRNKCIQYQSIRNVSSIRNAKKESFRRRTICNDPRKLMTSLK